MGSTRTLPVGVVPLAGAERPLAMLMIGKRALCPPLSTQWFCLMHGLSHAESTVLGDLLAGHEPREIAVRNGVALSTIRTQIARISDKTSLHGIRDLLFAVAALPPLTAIHGTTS